MSMRLLGLGIVKTPAHQALDRINGIFRVDNSLAFGGNAHQTIAALRKGDHRRRRAVAFAVGDHSRVTTFHDSYDAVCGTQVNTNNFTHCSNYPPRLFVFRNVHHLLNAACQPSHANSLSICPLL